MAFGLAVAGSGLGACFQASSAGDGADASFPLDSSTFEGSDDAPGDVTVAADSSSSDGGSPVDSAPADATSASDAMGSPDAGDSAPVDAVAETSLDAAMIPDGACNALSLQGLPSASFVTSTAALPAATGGVISDGTYYVTLATEYEQDAGSVVTGASQGVWVITGGGTHIEALVGGATGFSASYDLFTLDAGSTSIGVTPTCGDGMSLMGGSGAWPYSVATVDGGVQLSIIPNSSPLIWITYTQQ